MCQLLAAPLTRGPVFARMSQRKLAGLFKPAHTTGCPTPKNPANGSCPDHSRQPTRTLSGRIEPHPHIAVCGFAFVVRFDSRLDLQAPQTSPLWGLRSEAGNESRRRISFSRIFSLFLRLQAAFK